MTSYEINSEVKKLNDKILKISRNLYNQEKKVLPIILSLVFDKTYKQTYNILSKSVKNLDIKNSIIYKEIKGKYNIQRIKDNKTIFYNKLNRDIKNSLKESKSIEDIETTIEDGFNSEEKISQRLVNNEIGRVFNDITVSIYENENIKRVQWMAQLEKNTCSECESLDGEVFYLDEIMDY